MLLLTGATHAAEKLDRTLQEAGPTDSMPVALAASMPCEVGPDLN